MIIRAAAFALDKHRNQERKYTGEPYFNHVNEVAWILRDYTDDSAMISAAYLHDTLEDTDTTEGELLSIFGEDITNYVIGLTDVSRPEDGNRAKRKDLDRNHLWNQVREVQIIKCADLISNTQSIRTYDPDFAKVYIEEKKLLLSGMKIKGHPLYERALELTK